MSRYALRRSEGTPGLIAAAVALVAMTAIFVLSGTYSTVDLPGWGWSARELIERAVADTYRYAGQVIECSAAVAVAAVRGLPARDGATVVVVSGGNIDDQRLDEILARYRPD